MAEALLAQAQQLIKHRRLGFPKGDDPQWLRRQDGG